MKRLRGVDSLKEVEGLLQYGFSKMTGRTDAGQLKEVVEHIVIASQCEDDAGGIWVEQDKALVVMVGMLNQTATMFFVVSKNFKALSAVANTAVEWAQKHGYSKIVFFSKIEQKPLIRVARRYGYKLVSTNPDRYERSTL